MSMRAAEHPFSHLARQANKLMDQMQKGFCVYSSETWSPSVNLYETAGSYIVCVDLAGVDKAKIDLEVLDQRLKLRGTRAVPSCTPDADPHDAAASMPTVHADERQADARDAGEGAAPEREGRGVGEGELPAGQGGAEAHQAMVEGRAEAGARRVRIHLMEIDHGPFSREVELPSDAHKERIEATYRNGLLWVEIPKAAPPGG